MPKCEMEDCGYVGTTKEFADAGQEHPTVYHDLRCPKCYTTAVDSSDTFTEWASQGKVYGYGRNNTLKSR